MKRTQCLGAGLLAIAMGCASGGSTRPDRVSRITASPAAQEVAREAPAAWAEVLRVTSGGGDDVEAETELAMTWALTQSRAAQARRRAEQAELRRTAAETDAAQMEQQAEAQRSTIERDEAARRSAERAVAAAAAPAGVPTAERAAVAADLRQQAGLMLAAARMLGATEASEAPVRARIDAAEVASHGTDSAALWTTAGRAYAAAEGLLQSTRAAATHDAPTLGAALHQELSTDGTLDPHRDERGVVAVLRGVFVGTQLSPASRQRVETLARVINHHADARVRVEVFVGGAIRTTAESTARAQALSLAQALERAGVGHERIASEGLFRVAGGARSDDRAEVVLILPGER